jgi:hypothetical protein
MITYQFDSRKDTLPAFGPVFDDEERMTDSAQVSISLIIPHTILVKVKTDWLQDTLKGAIEKMVGNLNRELS